MDNVGQTMDNCHRSPASLATTGDVGCFAHSDEAITPPAEIESVAPHDIDGAPEVVPLPDVRESTLE